MHAWNTDANTNTKELLGKVATAFGLAKDRRQSNTMHQTCTPVLVSVLLVLLSRWVVLVSALVPDDDKDISSTTFSPPRAAQKFTKIIPDFYNSLIPPTTETGDPIKVEYSLLIMSMRGVNEMEQEISMEMNLRAFWRDRRLANLTSDKEFLVLHPTTGINHLWIPDVFIDHAKGIKQTVLMSKPTSLRLHKDGRVRYSARLTATIQCPMNFKYYPADTQKCRIELKSYAYPNDMLTLGWERGMGVILADGVSLANFYLIVEQPQEFNLDTSSGNYSGIRFHVKLERKMSYHLLQTYLPSTMFIIVSWLTFIMPQDSGAVMICMTTLLTITASFAAVRTSTPTVSYTKAIDIWMAVCMSYVFLSLVQHTITMRLRHMKFAKKEKHGKEKSSIYSVIKEEAGAETESLTLSLKNLSGDEQAQNEKLPMERAIFSRRRATYPRNSVQLEDKAGIEKINEYKVLGNRIRLFFSIITPVSFLLFNTFYWSWLLTAEQ